MTENKRGVTQQIYLEAHRSKMGNSSQTYCIEEIAEFITAVYNTR
jgi:hypothetical protein